MIESETKGWHGCFSALGKSSAEKYHLIVHMDEILGEVPKKKKRFKGDGVFGAINIEAIDDNLETVEDNVDIFKCQDEEGQENEAEETKKINELEYHITEINGQKKRCFSAIPKNRMRYHNKQKTHHKKPKKDTYPDCTKYQPKHENVKPRIIVGPAWDKMKGHNFQIKQDNLQYYLNHEDLTTQAKKVFIDFGKHTQRGDIMTSQNLRCLTATAFQPKHLNTKTNYATSRPSSVAVTVNEPYQEHITTKASRPYTAKPRFSTRPTTTEGAVLTQKNEFDDSISSKADSYDEFAHIFQKQFKKRGTISKSKLTKAQNEKQKIKAVDFKRVISRETLDQREDKKKAVIGFSAPNYKHTRERPIMMVVYDQKVHNKYKTKEMKGIEPSLLYDPNLVLNKVNNHTCVNPPNFSHMNSRPSDDNPLPSYMKKIHTKSTCYIQTAESLKMNNFADGKFMNTTSSFWPKKSFNKFVNLNLMNSEKFLDNALGDRRALQTENDYIAKSMKFYNKNFDDLIKESNLSKFDNVTYKTIRKENKLDTKDVQKFIENYYSNRKTEVKSGDNLNDPFN